MNGVRKEVLDELVRMRQWSLLLSQMKAGTAYTVEFPSAAAIDSCQSVAYKRNRQNIPSAAAIDSCQSVAYKRNRQNTGRRYRLRTDYDNLKMTITPYEDS